MAVFVTNRNMQHGVDSRGYCLADTFASDSLSKKAFAFGLSLICPKQAVKICISPHITRSPVDLIMKMKCWIFFKRHFWEENIIFFVCVCVCVVRYVQAKFIMYHPVTWCYVLQHWCLCVATLVFMCCNTGGYVLQHWWLCVATLVVMCCNTGCYVLQHWLLCVATLVVMCCNTGCY